MAEDSSNKRPSLFRQVLPAVIVALLVGTSSPWWIEKFFNNGDDDTSSENGPPTGDEVPGPGESVPKADFPGGSRPVYGAEFSRWPSNKKEHGSAQSNQGSYILQPVGNTWVGPGKRIDIFPLEDDFVFDVTFRISERAPNAALHVTWYGSGNAAATIGFFLEVWNDNNATYSLQTGILKDKFYLTRDKEIASRVLLPALVVASDWTKGNRITLRRQGGVAHVFVNDTHIKSFPVSVFTVSQVSVSAAFKSKISLTSLQARVPI